MIQQSGLSAGNRSFLKKKKSRIAEKYDNCGKDLCEYLLSEFGVEHIVLTDECELKKINFPEYSLFDAERMNKVTNWILIHYRDIDNATKKAVYESGGMSISLTDLIGMFENIQPGKLPLMLNEIGNDFSRIIVCGTGKNADRVYRYLSDNYRAEVVKTVPKELKAAIDVNKDEIVVIADLLPDLFHLLDLPKTVYVQWQHMTGNHRMVNDVYDITEHILPKLKKSGVDVVCVSVPEIETVRHKYQNSISAASWRLLKNKNFKKYIVKTNQHFHTEHLTVERFDVSVQRDRGYAQMYHNGSQINYDNGFRRTIGNKAAYKRRVFLFGPCLVMGAYVSDNDTIPSMMQKILGDDYLLLNRGQPNAMGLNLLMRSTEFRKGDILIYFSDAQAENCVNYDMAQSFNKIPHLHKHTTDSLMHCDACVNRQITDDLVKILEESGIVGAEAEKFDVEDKIFFGSEVKTIPEIHMLKNPQFEEYLATIRTYLKDGTCGTIVMNCNPFTNGHLYLITEASKQVDNLYVFIVEDDKSFFPFKDRIELVRRGTAHLKNVCVLNSGKCVSTSATVPGYFEKVRPGDLYLDASNEMMLFLQVVKAMNISVRFAGSEPLDRFTNQLNTNMQTHLERYGVKFVEIERKKNDGNVISASFVRKFLQEGNFDAIKKIVPETTYQYLLEKFSSSR